MSGKKRKADSTYYSFESDEGGKFSRIFSDMLKSAPWHDLDAAARNLYVCCKDQFFYQDAHPKITDNAETNKYYFYMNRGMWQKTYDLFKSKATFYKAMKALVTHGFVEVYRSGWNTRTKSIYRYSNKWHGWTAKDGVILNGASKAFINGRKGMEKQVTEDTS